MSGRKRLWRKGTVKEEYDRRRGRTQRRRIRKRGRKE